MKKEDLINCKVRVPTEEIKKVYEKLLELGFKATIRLQPEASYFFAYNTYFGWDSEGEGYFIGHPHKEIPYTDIIGEESEDFKDWKELSQWLADGKKVYYNGGLVEYGNDDFSDCGLALSPTNCKKSLPKSKPKEVVLYRHTYGTKEGNTITQTCWCSEHKFDSVLFELLKTETKKVILEN